MTPAASEWVEKAEEDWVVAAREQRTRRRPVYGAVCFHAQQCAEKYLKAILAENGLTIPRIHDLVTARNLARPVCSPLGKVRSARLGSLSRAAVEYRYPGGRVTKRMAIAAMTTANQVRSLARAALGL